MKKKSVFVRIYEKICRDTGKQNESAKLIAVVRLLTLSMLMHSLVCCVLICLAAHTGALLLSVISPILFLAVFALSFRWSTFISYCILNACILFCTYMNVFCFGWDIGIQHLLLVLLVFVFFCKYRHEPFKISYSIFLFLLRLHLFYYCRSHEPAIILDDGLTNALQMVNTFFVFLSLGLVSYLFSSNTQEMEGKLIDYNRKLMKQANTDTLTGLYNRRRTMEYLANLLATADTQISICLCDIDHFKRVNDTYGHNMGDVVLKTLSETFQKRLPPDTFISRWGGEEFLLIFPRLNGDEAITALETLRQKIRDLTFDGGFENFTVSLTYGLVEYDYHSDITTLLKEADEKLYVGKEGGRDQIVF
ncbi:MAG TPA: hypothetical protein DD414_06775 [Lachnospiraceae bacterium]|nr:hypothetical protein [Lachnospiraceae bacterium]